MVFLGGFIYTMAKVTGKEEAFYANSNYVYQKGKRKG